MMVRLLLSVAFVANVLVLVVCTDNPCPINEVLSNCTQAVCRTQNCTDRGKPVVCPLVAEGDCEEGCVCQEGYLRNEDGCVPEEKCNANKCPPFEEWDNCSNAVCRANFCYQKGLPVFCVSALECVPGCLCQDSYLRDESGVCVPEEDCIQTTQVAATSESSAIATSSESQTSSNSSAEAVVTSEPKSSKANTCPINEQLSDCIQTVCRAQKCIAKNWAIACPGISQEDCEKGCVCQEGYLRDDNDVCIPENECIPNPCQPNEEFSNCTQAICRTLNCSDQGKPLVCPLVAEGDCEKGCVCQAGYLRNEDGCVPEEKCNTNTCPVNEQLSDCIQTVCRAQKCIAKNWAIACPGISQEDCEKGCVCQEGYLRDDNDVCIPENECIPNPCQPNEEFSNCTQAICRTINCSDKGKPLGCPLVAEGDCEKGCVCQEGYLRNEDGCVPEDKCNANTCPVNEQLSDCIQTVCRAQKCIEKNWSIPCPGISQEDCEKGCVCQEGYLRDDNDVCIPENECIPNPCQPNEEFSNCTQAICRTLNCSDQGKPLVCSLVAEGDCEKGCVCQEGYLRNEDGCVPEDKCNANKCPPFEEWDNCSNAVCRANFCYQKGLQVFCVSALECVPGCLCQDSYLRDESGVCVPEEDCIHNPCPINEVLSNCTQAVCRTQNCTDRGKPVVCPLVAEGDCEEGCVCQEGYLRNEDGCVPEEKCNAHFCPAFEEWSTCAQATCRAQNCSEKGETIVCPAIAEGYCEEACVCQENYLRNENGECVPEDQCPSKTCGENEVLDSCSLTCNSDNCPQSADEEQVCTQSDPCVPACKCEFNYKRSKNGTCIPTTDCPPFDCSAKPNEEFVACPPFCPTDECGKPRLEGRCPFNIGTFLQCNPKCQCMDGYGRVNGTCVPFEECPDLCPANEVYSSCVKQTCRPQNCSDRDVAMETCTTRDAASCKRGCVCQENYYRNDEGVCVSYEECGGENPAT